MADEQLQKRGLKTRKPISNSVDIGIVNELDQLHQQTKIPKSKLLDEALEDLLEKYQKQGKYKRD
ncbi:MULTISPECIES: ribbon-helix-helix domain-containing protein [Cytobacillus]|uniref:Predicted DNA-binding protein ribbon-helix-helix domain-containing protein n=1 Tax=Cytobacillus horneckiae TaxID=549687 RepID=A0A2N0ZMZ5_9BACI|nr:MULTISPECIES: ribbon-helix-helix domain-containing protein [Cytobacillus]MDK7667394.1 ribbon-helix-helix domain-containing protein [Cytobacillus oceanisediminis]MEC1157696.1 ribbon-helix-helix domain-containing protein [Cytobacillus horneckiae]PKG30889.1 hypothetical protein CWS20_00925 [Cytobacillus horneckiae]